MAEAIGTSNKNPTQRNDDGGQMLNIIDNILQWDGERFYVDGLPCVGACGWFVAEWPPLNQLPTLKKFYFSNSQTMGITVNGCRYSINQAMSDANFGGHGATDAIGMIHACIAEMGMVK